LDVLNKIEINKRNKDWKSEFLDAYSDSCNFFANATTSNSKISSDNKKTLTGQKNQQQSIFST